MNRRVVAVDFGTSRSAFAVTQEGGHGEDIQVFVPEDAGHLSRHDMKTPSNVLLDATGQEVLSFGYTAEEEYFKQGVEAEENVDDRLFFRCFKMGLHRPASDTPTVEATNGKSLNLSVVLTKALEHVKQDAVNKLNGGSGPNVAATEVVWVLTVPAIWNDWAKSMMRKAAYNAGMIREVQSTNLVLALEPECVCISLQMETDIELWDVGRKFLILDCGGGTVDITAHEVASSSPLRLKELMAPEGGALGSMRVDDKFYEFFEALVGVDRFLQLRRTPAFLSLARNWEERKVAFRGDEKQKRDGWCAVVALGDVLWELDIDGREWAQLLSVWNERHANRRAVAQGKARLGLSFDLMMSFFEEPVQRVSDKVNAVISGNRALRDVGWVVIAGGFGRSPILQARIRQNFEATQTRVLVSRYPDLATVKGAAAFGARVNIFQSRKAKYTYGVSAGVLYNNKNPQHRKHEKSKFMARDGRWRLRAFRIHGKVGDDVSVGSKPVRLEYRAETEDQTELNFRILVTKSPDVVLENEPGVQALGSWKVPIDRTLPYERRRFTIEFSFSESETLCKCYRFNGHKYVKVKEMEISFPSDVHWIYNSQRS